jgi:hypothetical protein
MTDLHATRSHRGDQLRDSPGEIRDLAGPTCEPGVIRDKEYGVAQDDRDQDRALLAYLRGCSSAAADDGNAAADAAVPDDDVDRFLQAMGYNRIERRELRRREPPRANPDRHRPTTIKRFAFYITHELPDLTPERVAELADEWASLANYDLDLAQRWWNSGVNPDAPGELTRAVIEGLRIDDLGKVVNGKTVAEHLQAGSSPIWCHRALQWQRSA